MLHLIAIKDIFFRFVLSRYVKAKMSAEPLAIAAIDFYTGDRFFGHVITENFLTF